MEFFHKVTKYPFMHTRKVWYGVSGVAIIASIVLLFVHGLNLGIDFTGGVVLEFAYPKTANIERTRGALSEAGFHEAQVQNFGDEHTVLVRLLPTEGQDVNQVSKSVTDALKKIDPDVELRRAEVVGPQVGEELTNQGGLAILFTFVLIGIYTWFRFQWKMGVSAVIATLHDPLLILGFFAVTDIPFDLAVLAAILAVIGYSLNDTVVVFDRVRENFHSMRRASAEEIMDASINQTLSRTIITSGATLLVVVVLLIEGGETLRGFSWALTIGILVGTYSSIYVAGALALDMKLSAQDLIEQKKDTSELDAIP
ncbi:protein translocase subunit SecF [Steroidobacter sp.]|uniref:protein translocase subunit SecF n=1 Tax=Steroidobacter sp. TaxID=1978227 RepID=UPI001A5C116B|nr:protein translocase subunit SecF [Steroidobacter sp.]MBL8268901.1 protein translocase subunit SecF [Steroidobacter sp.]